VRRSGRKFARQVGGLQSLAAVVVRRTPIGRVSRRIVASDVVVAGLRQNRAKFGTNVAASSTRTDRRHIRLADLSARIRFQRNNEDVETRWSAQNWLIDRPLCLIGKSAVIGESQGAEHSPTTRECSLIKGGARQVPLNQLWELLPAADQEEIGRIVAQMIAQQILPSERREGPHESVA
jgi:hypothetical protein